MFPQALLGLMGSEFTGMVACFSKWVGNLTDRWVRVPCDGTFPRGRGLMGNAIFCVLLDQVQWLGVSDRAAFFKCSHCSWVWFPGYIWSHYHWKVWEITSMSCLILICTFYSTNARLLEVSCSYHDHHGWCPSCGSCSAGVPFRTFSAWLTPVHPSASSLPGSLLGMEFASLPGSPVAFKDSFNQLIFMWYVPNQNPSLREFKF